MNTSILPPEIQALIKNAPQVVVVQLPTDLGKLVYPPDAGAKITAFKASFKALGAALTQLDVERLQGVEEQISESVERMPDEFALFRKLPLSEFQEMLGELGRAIRAGAEIGKDTTDARAKFQNFREKLDEMVALTEKFATKTRKVTVLINGDEADAEAFSAEILKAAVNKGKKAQRDAAEKNGWTAGTTNCCEKPGYNPKEGSDESPIHDVEAVPDTRALPPSVQFMLQLAESMGGIPGMEIQIGSPLVAGRG